MTPKTGDPTRAETGDSTRPQTGDPMSVGMSSRWYRQVDMSITSVVEGFDCMNAELYDIIAYYSMYTNDHIVLYYTILHLKAYVIPPTHV